MLGDVSMTDLVSARKSKGITIKEAAAYIGVSEETMKSLESNTEDIGIIDAVMLTELYGTDVGEIRF